MKKIILLTLLLVFQFSIKAQTYLSESFDTEIPSAWTITDEGAATGDSWISGLQGGANGLNGTNCAVVDSDANGNGSLLIETLTSPVFDTTGAVNLFLDFDQFYNNIGGDTAVVEIFDGTSWVQLLNQTADIGGFDAPDEQHIDITAFSNATMQIRFVYNDNDEWAWYWLVDNVAVYNSTCNNPSDLMVLAITDTTADLTWTAGGSETTWEVINQEQGGAIPGDTSTGAIVSTNNYQATGLTQGQNYEFYVRANCDADGLSIWSGPFQYRVSGPGELCENPIMVTSPLPYTTNDDTLNYGDDYDGPAGTDCGSGFNYLSGEDVVYAYTATSDTSINIELSNLSDTYTGVFIYDSCTNIGIQCLNGAVNGFSTENISIDEFTVTNGATYYIVISTWPAPQSVAYTLTISENTCINQDATFTVVEDCANGEQFNIAIDITDLGSATQINISDDQGNTDVATAIGIVTLGPYANGTNVIVTLENNDDANCMLTSDTLIQEFCPPDNDLCENATTIACGDTATGNTSAATDTGAPTDTCGTTSGAPGVWYVFEGDDSIVTASLCGSDYDSKIQIYEGPCGTLTCVTGEDDDFGNCGDTNPQVDFIANNGTTYYIYVFGFDVNVGNYNLALSCIDIPEPPANDECENATVVIANDGSECIETASGSLFGASASSQSSTCGGSADDDVWFEFVATSANHAIALQNIVGDTQDLEHALYEGADCNSLTQLYCSDPNQSVANNLTIGNTYRIRVNSFTANPLQNVTFDVCVIAIPPPLYVSTTDFTVEELVEDVLVDSDCQQVFNITYSTGSNFGSDNGIGYFENNGSGFPLERGLVLISGNANGVPGPEDEILSTLNGWPGDADLENAIPDLASGDSNDATIIEFDFIPVINTMSFDFIFAAEEYGTFQCQFADSFAFLLTDSNGVTTNLALVPGTTDPISVFTIRDMAHNSNCNSVNPEFFGNFYGDTGLPTIASPIDLMGHTVVMTANSAVIPNEQYHIKMVIADAGDNAYDSAVFLGGGSFDIGQLDLGDDILLASGDAQCEGTSLTLDAGEQPNNSTITWYQDGVVIDGETSQTIDVNTTAFYRADIVIDGTDCTFSDEILIEFFPNPEIAPIQNPVVRCVGLEVTLGVEILNPEGLLDPLEYTWYFDGTEIQVGPESTYTIQADSDFIGEFTVFVNDGRLCTGETIITVVEGIEPIVAPVEALIDKCINEDATLEVNVSNDSQLSGDYTYSWFIGGTLVQESSDNTYIHASDEPETLVTVVARDNVSQCSGETSIEVIYYINENCLDLPQGLSPNGDGQNDCLILDHLEDKLDIDRIDVFNRYGVKVFELNEYVGQWCGRDDADELLAVGTYFYTIYFNTDNDPITSWIYLNY